VEYDPFLRFSKKDALSVVSHALEPQLFSHFKFTSLFSMMYTHTFLCARAQLGHLGKFLECMLIDIIDGADVGKGCRGCYRVPKSEKP
jgi:hypothetical protein